MGTPRVPTTRSADYARIQARAAGLQHVSWPSVRRSTLDARAMLATVRGRALLPPTSTSLRYSDNLRVGGDGSRALAVATDHELCDAARAAPIGACTTQVAVKLTV